MARKRQSQLLAEVELSITKGESYNSIVAGVGARFGVSRRTVSRYVTTVRTRWVAEELELRPLRRAELRRRLQMAFNLAMDTKKASAAAAVLKVWAKFDGVEVPGDQTPNATVLDIRAMSPQQRSAEIEQLLTLRATALGKRSFRTRP